MKIILLNLNDDIYQKLKERIKDGHTTSLDLIIDEEDIDIIGDNGYLSLTLTPKNINILTRR